MVTLGPPKGIDTRVAVLRISRSRQLGEKRSLRLSKLTEYHIKKQRTEGRKGIQKTYKELAKGRFMKSLYTIRKESKLFP